MDLSDLLNNPVGKILTNSAKSKLGLDDKQLSGAIGAAVPAILSGLSANAKSEEGAKSLNKALESKHDGSLLNNIADAMGNLSSLQQDGNGILDHIFGNNKDSVQKAAAKQAGIGADKMGALFSMLAPIVMAYLGKEKQTKGANSGGLGDILGGMLSASTGGKNSQMGGIVDLVGGLLGGGNTKGKKGGLGGLLDLLK